MKIVKTCRSIGGKLAKSLFLSQYACGFVFKPNKQQIIHSRWIATFPNLHALMSNHKRLHYKR